MSVYPGFRDFRTEEPIKLRADLQRFNATIEQGFSATEAGAHQRWRVVIVPGASGAAVHGDTVKAGANQAATVALPKSAAEKSGRTVRVYRQGGFAVKVTPASGETINGAASLTLTTVGFREFEDDGAGNWMTNA